MKNTGLMNLYNLAWELSANKFQSSDLISGCVAFFDDKMTNWHDLLWGKYVLHLIDVLFLIHLVPINWVYLQKKPEFQSASVGSASQSFLAKNPDFWAKIFTRYTRIVIQHNGYGSYVEGRVFDVDVAICAARWGVCMMVSCFES